MSNDENPNSSDPTRVIVAGDWHGNTQWAQQVIAQLPQLLPDESPRIVVHCGDFGVWPGVVGAQYLRVVTDALSKVNGLLLFVDGNHEWHPHLISETNALIRKTANAVHPRVPLTERIYYLSRGHRWIWHGRVWLALGGAASVDRTLRTPHRDWWSQERITPRQAAVVIAAGGADVMVTHDCPSAIPITLPPPSALWDPIDLRLSDAHRARLQSVVDAVQPDYLIHGHLHMGYRRTVPLAYGDFAVRGLDCDGMPDNWDILDVTTMAYGQ